MNLVKRALEASDEYAKQSTWTDFALIKACLCAVGVMIGLSVPKRNRKSVFAGAAVVCTATWLCIMGKFLPILKDHFEKE